MSALDALIPLLTTPEAAKLLHCSPRTLERQRVEGTGPPFTRVGRLVRYRPVDLAAYLASRVRRSNADAPRPSA